MGRTQFDGPECIKELVPKPEKKNSISDLFSRSRMPAKPHVDKTHKSGIVQDQTKFSEDDLSIEEQKAFLAAIEPDKDATDKMSTCIEEEQPLEQCGTKRPFEDIGNEYIVPSEDHSKQKIPSMEPLKDSGFLKTTSPDVQKKKKSNVHMTKDKQQSLLSYFGKS